MGLSGDSYTDFVYYTFNGLVIIGVNFGKQHFQKLIVKPNSFYKDCVVPQVLKKSNNRNNFFFAKNCFMFSSKKVNKYNNLYIIYYTKDHIFLSHNRLISS